MGSDSKDDESYNKRLICEKSPTKTNSIIAPLVIITWITFLVGSCHKVVVGFAAFGPFW